MDDGHRSASSIAAAGLYNPFILKRRKLSWKAQDFFPYSREFFHWLEELLALRFDHEIGIARRIHDVEEYNDWTTKEGDPILSTFLGQTSKSEEISPKINAPLGYRRVPRAGYVDTDAFLNRSRQWFEEKGHFIEETFDEEKVVSEETLTYQDKSYSAIIVALGYRSREASRFFGELPFTPAKGHTITIHCPDLELDTILSGPCFILPLGKGLFRVGSTYSWSDLNEIVEEKEVERLLVNFRSFCPLDFKVIDSRAGVRPATKDRRPLIGASELDARIHIFGGMGSRAIMCAPLLAKMHLDHIRSGEPLWPEMDVNRFRL